MLVEEHILVQSAYDLLCSSPETALSSNESVFASLYVSVLFIVTFWLSFRVKHNPKIK